MQLHKERELIKLLHISMYNAHCTYYVRKLSFRSIEKNNSIAVVLFNIKNIDEIKYGNV